MTTSSKDNYRLKVPDHSVNWCIVQHPVNGLGTMPYSRINMRHDGTGFRLRRVGHDTSAGCRPKSA